MTIESWMTARWNNRFSLWLSTIFFGFIAITVFTALLSEQDAFKGLVFLGCLF